MSASCCNQPDDTHRGYEGYRRVLWAVLIVNAAMFAGGDSNMRSAWICTRNDVLGNLAVLLAAVGVFGTGTGWPDVAVAAIMAALALQGASWSSISPGLNSRPQVCFNLQSSYAASRARPRST